MRPIHLCVLTFVHQVSGYASLASHVQRPALGVGPWAQRLRAYEVLLRFDDESEAVTGPDLFADFVVEPDRGSAAAMDIEGDDDDDDDGDWVDVDEDWDEPSGPEEPPPGVVVESIAKYLPQLLRKKYGDDWELLLADSDEDGDDEDGATVVDADGEEDDAVDVSASSFVEEVAHDDEEDEDGPSEAELRALVAKAADAEDDEDADEDADADEIRVADLDVSHLAESSPEEIAESLSPKLAEFLVAQAAGDVALPRPFPESEWLHVFVTAMSQDRRSEEMAATWANLRVLLAENFDDLTTAVEDPAAEPDAAASALMKARALHAATGLACLAETTCVHVVGDGAKPPSETLYSAEAEGGVDEMLARMRPSSAPEREVFYSSAAAFVDANHTFVGEGGCSMPLGIAEARHATIATSTACDDLFVQVAEGLGLKFVGSDAFDDFYKLQTLKKTGKLAKKTGGSMLLKEKILREATVLDASILKVSSFLNHMVDVQLMEACGEELAERLEDTQPTKVLTVEATGLIPGMFVGKALSLPVVFARKSRQIGVSDSYQTSYKSSVKANTQDLYVSIEYLNPGDRVIIIDDFLAGGTTADALIRLCRMAGATVVGGGFLIEKSNDAGRAFLSGYEIPLESLSLVEITDGQVRIVESEEADLSEWANDQAELDRLLSADGRINLDFTIDAPPLPDAEVAATVVTAEDSDLVDEVGGSAETTETTETEADAETEAEKD